MAEFGKTAFIFTDDYVMKTKTFLLAICVGIYFTWGYIRILEEPVFHVTCLKNVCCNEYECIIFESP